jgi:hypothetical protein
MFWAWKTASPLLGSHTSPTQEWPQPFHSHGTIQGLQELDSPVMIIVRDRDYISPYVVHNHREPLEHGIYV